MSENGNGEADPNTTATQPRSESTPPLKASEEREYIKAFLIRDSNMKEGDKWYVLHVKWWEQWARYVDFEDDSDKGNATQPRPGPIDNSSLADEKGDLRRDIQENLDYTLVPRAVWKRLRHWYGVVNERKFPRYVVSVSSETGSRHLRVDLYPLSLWVRKFEGVAGLRNAPDELQFHRDSTVKVLRHFLAGRDYSPPHNIRVWLKKGDDEQLLPDDTPLAQIDLSKESGNELIFEVKQSGGWPKESPANSSSEPGSSSYSYSSSSSSTTTESDSSSSRSWLGLGSLWRRDTHSTGHSLGAGLCGLSNLGNTCFMNSALQCLSHAVPLTDYFLTGRYKDEINSSNPLGMKGQLAEHYAELLDLLWCQKYVSVSPTNFKHTIGKFAPQFSGYQQHDAQELLAFLLDGLHEDLNRVKQKPYVESVESNGRPDEVVAAEAWERHLMRNKSIIVDHFQGQFKSTVVCPECKKVSITFDPFMYLSVPLLTNDSTFSLYLVYSDPSRPATKFSVTVPKHASSGELKAKLAALAGLSPDELQLAEIFQSRIYLLIRDDRGVSDIRPADTIYAYQIVPPAAAPAPASSTNSSASSATAAPAPASAPAPATDGTQAEPAVATEPADPSPPTYVAVLSHKGMLFSYPIIISYKGTRTVGDVLTQIASEMIQRMSTTSLQQLREKDIDPLSLFRFRFGDIYGVSCGTCRDAGGMSSECPHCPLDPKSTAPFASGDGDKAVVVCDWTSQAQELYVGSVPHKDHMSSGSDHLPHIALKECFDLFTRQEKLSAQDAWYCSNCKEHREATKKFDLWKLPELLVIHLKRFQYSRMWRDKIDAVVDFPLSGLDLSPWTVSTPSPPLYDLFAVSNHSGGLGGGHYTAYVLGPDSEWYSCNDTHVGSASATHVVSAEAYLLFYKRRGSSPSVPPSLLSSSAGEETPPSSSVSSSGDGHNDNTAVTSKLDMPE